MILFHCISCGNRRFALNGSFDSKTTENNTHSMERCIEKVFDITA